MMEFRVELNSNDQSLEFASPRVLRVQSSSELGLEFWALEQWASFWTPLKPESIIFHSLLIEMPSQQKLIKVVFSDRSSKTIALQKGTSAQSVVSSLVSKLDIEAEADTFALFEVRPDGSRCLSKSEIPYDISSSWGSTPCSFHLRKRYYLSPQVLPSSPADLQFLYHQARHDLLAGDLVCSEEEIVKLAALSCQISFGDYRPDSHIIGFLSRSLHEYIPQLFFFTHDTRVWEQNIFDHFSKLRGTSSIEAMTEFLNKCKTCLSYGHSLFSCKWLSDGSKRVNLSVILAVSVTGISIFRLSKKELVVSFPFDSLETFSCSATSFSFTHGEPHVQSQFECRKGYEIVDVINGYMDLLNIGKVTEGVGDVSVVKENNEQTSNEELSDL
ncbi:hypothetical protein RCL1_006200 [Eukaryota sp. TZLM3-RCL]